MGKSRHSLGPGRGGCFISSKRSTTLRIFKKPFAARKIRRCAKGSDHSDKFYIQEKLSKLTIAKDAIPPLQAQSFSKEEETLDDQGVVITLSNLDLCYDILK
ncbi:hypothetical protein ISN44_As01g012250 [Arabidopsis suecica]|uniref:Uncharacterized protein n=1 Tax=Arabidopsis suecica TaxID=45249 RepID=A0A8T2H402_ARASU|nr:hypothetical protein ISN44_As01g012250 [Arabidopsis suecica]